MKVEICVPRDQYGVSIVKDILAKKGIAESDLLVSLTEEDIALLHDPKQLHFKRSTRLSIKGSGRELVNLSLSELETMNQMHGKENLYSLEFGANLPINFELNVTFDNYYNQEE